MATKILINSFLSLFSVEILVLRNISLIHPFHCPVSAYKFWEVSIKHHVHWTSNSKRLHAQCVFVYAYTYCIIFRWIQIVLSFLRILLESEHETLMIHMYVIQISYNQSASEFRMHNPRFQHVKIGLPIFYTCAVL